MAKASTRRKGRAPRRASPDNSQQFAAQRLRRQIRLEKAIVRMARQLERARRASDVAIGRLAEDIYSYVAKLPWLGKGTADNKDSAE